MKSCMVTRQEEEVSGKKRRRRRQKYQYRSMYVVKCNPDQTDPYAQCNASIRSSIRPPAPQPGNTQRIDQLVIHIQPHHQRAHTPNLRHLLHRLLSAA
jgi:hypothetical protein